MENNKQSGSLLSDEEKEQGKIPEENRQRIISSQEVRLNNSSLDPSNELGAGKKKEAIASPENLGSGSGEDETISENHDGEIKSQVKTTLPPQELLNNRENDIAKSKNEGVKNRLLSLQKKKNQSAMILALVLGLFVIIVLTGLYLFSDKLFKKEDPQQIIKSSLEAMNNVESYAFKGDFNLDFIDSQDKEEKFSLMMKFDGETDESNPNNIKSSFNIKPEITVSQEGGSENISLDFSMMSFGEIGKETAYLKLNDFDLGAAGMIYGEAIIPYKNKWYFLDMKELQEKSGADMEEDFNSEEMIEKIKELLKQYEMIKFEKDLGLTKINGRYVYHYQVRLDSEAVLNFYVEVLNLMPSSRGSELVKTELKQNKEEILVVLDEIMDNVKTEIFIGKEDKRIYRIMMNGKYDQEFMFGLEEKIDKINQKEESSRMGPDINNSSLSFNMTMALSDFNQPVEITKPEESEDLLKILEEAMAGFMDGMISPGIDPDLDSDSDSDNDGLTDVMEEIYGTDKNNPDTDGDGYLDGDEVENGYDPLVSGSAKLDYGKMFE